MKKTIKVTSGVLTAALVVSNVNTVEQTTATGVPAILIQDENQNVSAKIVSVEGKHYLEVTATKNVQNVNVSVVIANNTLKFKHKELLAGETVKFELDVLNVVAGKKSLPKTSVVRDELTLKGTVNALDVSVSVKYDVEVSEPVIAVEVPSTPVETPKSEDENKEEKAEETTPVVKEPEVSVDNKPAEEPAPTPAPAPAAVVAPAQPVVETPAVTQPVVTTPSQPAEVRTVVTPAPVATPVNSVVTTNTWNLPNNDAVAQEVFAQLNAHRVANGLQPLTWNTSINAGTLVRANELVALVKAGSGNLHARLDGTAWHTAFGGLGFVAAENLSYSNSGAAGMMGFWKGSASHNAAMLNSAYKSVSIQVVQVGGTYYGVQIFSK